MVAHVLAPSIGEVTAQYVDVVVVGLVAVGVIGLPACDVVLLYQNADVVATGGAVAGVVAHHVYSEVGTVEAALHTHVHGTGEREHFVHSAFPCTTTHCEARSESVAVDDTIGVTGDGEEGIDGGAFIGAEVGFGARGHSVAAGVYAHVHDLVAVLGFESRHDHVALGAIAAVDAGEILQQRGAVLRAGAHQRLGLGERGNKSNEGKGVFHREGLRALKVAAWGECQ